MGGDLSAHDTRVYIRRPKPRCALPIGSNGRVRQQWVIENGFDPPDTDR